jgi:DNA-directed RNA polymerase specialized sigma24 family protein
VPFDPLAPDGNKQPLPAALLADLASSDREVVSRAFRALVPLALDKVSQRFGLRKLRVPDTPEAEAALWSACSSFQSHCRNDEFEDAKNLEELAGHLLRIAENRAQRKHRQDKRIEDAVRRGTTRDGHGQPIAVEFTDEAPGPEETAMVNDVLAYLEDVIDVIKEEMQRSPGLARTVHAYLENMERKQEDLAAELGVNQATVSRHIAWFKDRIRQLLGADPMA